MDPLSVTASIIAVLQAARTLIDCLHDIKNASDDQNEIAKEASNIYAFLQNVRNRVERANDQDPWFDRVRSMKASGGLLEQLKDVLNKMVEKIRGRNQLERAIKWPFTKKEVREALERMERLKSSISVELDIDHLCVSSVKPAKHCPNSSSAISQEIKNDTSTVKQGLNRLLMGHEGLLLSNDRSFPWHLTLRQPSYRISSLDGCKSQTHHRTITQREK